MFASVNRVNSELFEYGSNLTNVWVKFWVPRWKGQRNMNKRSYFSLFYWFMIIYDYFPLNLVSAKSLKYTFLFILGVFLICVFCGCWALDWKVFLFLQCLLFYSTAFSASPKTTKSSSALRLTWHYLFFLSQGLKLNTSKINWLRF